MSSFWSELKRRNVVRVGIAYSAAVWALLQVADLVLSNLDAPEWIIRVLIVSAAIGFPAAIALAWLFELTPEGIKAEGELPAGTTRRFTARQANLTIIALLIIAIGFLVVDNYLLVEAPREASLAVLPFTNLSASGDDSAEFFSIGMHDALLTQLAKIGGIKVISRTSVMEYANRTQSIPEIAEALGVATIMEATVLRAGDRLQINAQLINGETDGHLWGEIFERELTAENIFAVQREMATSIAGLLQASLTPEEEAELERVPTQSEPALQAFYTGNEFARQPNERTNMPFAVDAYQRAVDLDPTFAIAWAALARAHAQMFRMGGDRTAERALDARRALDRAQALAPDAPELYVATGQYEMFVNENLEAAIAALEEALRRFPGSADVLNGLASTYRRAGRYEDSLAFRLRAMELDPRNTDALVSLGPGTYARLHDYDAAAETLDRALQILPDNPQLHWARTLVPLWRDGDVSAIKALLADPPVPLGRVAVRGAVLAALYDRDYAAALAVLEHLEADIISDRNRLLLLGQVYTLNGREDEATSHFEELLEVSTSAVSSDPSDVRSLVYRAAALVGLGRRDAAIAAGQDALDLIENLVDLDTIEIVREDLVLHVFAPASAVELAVETLDALLSNPGFFSIEGLLPDPRLDPIRDDPQFEALVALYRRPPQ